MVDFRLSHNFYVDTLVLELSEENDNLQPAQAVYVFSGNDTGLCN